MQETDKVQSPWPEEPECGTCNMCWDCLVGEDDTTDEYEANSGYCQCWHCEANRNWPYDPQGPFK